jgi:hypothetical protein
LLTAIFVVGVAPYHFLKMADAPETDVFLCAIPGIAPLCPSSKKNIQMPANRLSAYNKV